MNTPEIGPSSPKARVEIIPLIDVIFFLLATFVLFTLTLHRVRVFDPALPKSTKDQSGDADTTVFIQASVDGTYHWRVGAHGTVETITAAELGPRLQDFKRKVHEPRVLVRSDGNARLRSAVLVLDEVRRADIRDVAIETLVSPTGS
jgi:biopolymer transport protein ExbD